MKDIEDAVNACQSCQEQRNSNPKPALDELKLPSLAMQPMLEVGCDLFTATGKQWLAFVDCYSGFSWTCQLRKLDPRTVTMALENWFNDFGWPSNNRTDGRPQFRTKFKDFCSSQGIEHELSSPYMHTTKRATGWRKKQ